MLNISHSVLFNKVFLSHYKSLIIPIPKKGDSTKCSNYRTLSLISHPSKILLRNILNRQIQQA